MQKRIYPTWLCTVIAAALVFSTVQVVRAASADIDSSYKWAWGTNIGWINFKPANGGPTVYDDHLEGYVWAENVGWIRLGTYEGGGAYTYANDAATTYGVNRDGAGNLSGYAWGTNIGWVNFNPTHGGVTVDTASGAFDGYAWGENVGWISFNGGSGANAYQVIAGNLSSPQSGGGAGAGGLSVTEDGEAAQPFSAAIHNLGAGAYIGKISRLEVTFSDAAYDPAGSSETDDVTNPNNYLIIRPGPDGIYNTTSCLDVSNNGGALLGDDIRIPTGPVVYHAESYSASVVINNGVSLPYSEYRLFLCGTTSLTDLAGNSLNDGVDSVLTFETIRASQFPNNGFAPGRMTRLPAQPGEGQYTALGDLWLEIPSLEVAQNIVGVPWQEDAWDVSWLGSDIGYLEGTAFPTWEGNTVLTGHVYDENGQAGPFVDLAELKWGDEVSIHAWGSTYKYQVRTVQTEVDPADTRLVTKSETYDWITLVTCHGYDEQSDSYRWRTVVRAVLLDATPD